MPSLDSNRIAHAVDMQQRSYKLLQWMAAAVKNGFISFGTAHDYSNLPDAAAGWIAGHYNNIPDNARVSLDDLPEFTAFFSTYLQNSFDLIASPGKQLYSPDAHCFCPMCSWLVDAPNLKPKKLTTADKRRANKMRANAVSQLAIENSVAVSATSISELLDDINIHSHSSLLAYGHDLLQRLNGIANGPAVLSLWRGFAWNENGSPKPKFQLKADMIMDAESQVLAVLKNAA